MEHQTQKVLDEGRVGSVSIGSERRKMQSALHKLSRQRETLRKHLRQANPYQPQWNLQRQLDRVNTEMQDMQWHLDQASQEAGSHYERDNVPKGRQLQEVVNLIG